MNTSIPTETMGIGILTDALAVTNRIYHKLLESQADTRSAPSTAHDRASINSIIGEGRMAVDKELQKLVRLRRAFLPAMAKLDPKDHRNRQRLIAYRGRIDLAIFQRMGAVYGEA